MTRVLVTTNPTLPCWPVFGMLSRPSLVSDSGNASHLSVGSNFCGAQGVRQPWNSRSDFAFLKQRELFPEEQMLGSDCIVLGKNNRINVNNSTFYKSSQPLPTKLGSIYCAAQISGEF